MRTFRRHNKEGHTSYLRRLYSRQRGVGRSVASVCLSVCLYVCPRSNRKRLELAVPKSVDV